MNIFLCIWRVGQKTKYKNCKTYVPTSQPTSSTSSTSIGNHFCKSVQCYCFDVHFVLELAQSDRYCFPELLYLMQVYQHWPHMTMLP